MALINLSRQFLLKLLTGTACNWGSDDIRAVLVSSAFTPAHDTDDFWNDVSANELANGNGYVTNGVALASKTSAYTAANAWGTAWAASTAFALGSLVRPVTGNGYIYRAQAAGSSGGAEPTWPTTLGGTVVDSGVTWTCVGRGLALLGAANPSWSGITFTTMRYLYFVNRTPSTDATRPLIGYVDFGSAQTIGGGTFTFQVPGQILFAIPAS